MCKPNYLVDEPLAVVLPRTADDIAGLWDDIELLMEPLGGVKPGLQAWLSDHPHTLYLFYAYGEPVAFVRLDDRQADPTLGRKTVEIHGGIRPEYEDLGIAHQAGLLVLNAAFKSKRNVIAKIDPANQGALGFVRRWGFKRINTERGLAVYRLTRDEWHGRQHTQS